MSGAQVSAPSIAFQGAPGAFSHEALRDFRPDSAPVPCPRFEDVFQALEEGRVGLAFLPVENSIAGPVPEVAARLAQGGLRRLGEHAWPIRMQLMAQPGARLEGLRIVASHPMALKQCGAFLSAHGLKAEPASDTAGAAADLARGEPDLSRAVLAPRAAAELYGLSLLAENVQDRADNVTRFLLLALDRAWSLSGRRRPAPGRG